MAVLPSSPVYPRSGAVSNAKTPVSAPSLDLSREGRDRRRMTAESERLEDAILALVAERGPDRTACPSEAARAVGGDHPDGWGPLMQPIRRIAVRLAQEGRIVITRKGRPVDPDDFRGVYRLGLPRQD
jgi:hypothetical protein